jgi:hypothetical protein
MGIIENVNPERHLSDPGMLSLEEEYKQMSMNEAREAEALDWAEALIEHGADDAR